MYFQTILSFTVLSSYINHQFKSLIGLPPPIFSAILFRPNWTMKWESPLIWCESPNRIGSAFRVMTTRESFWPSTKPSVRPHDDARDHWRRSVHAAQGRKIASWKREVLSACGEGPVASIGLPGVPFINHHLSTCRHGIKLRLKLMYNMYCMYAYVCMPNLT